MLDTVFSGFLIRFRDNGLIDIKYKKYCFYEQSFRGRVIGASTVSANTNINQDSLKKLCICLPPTKAEQEAIAGALSDTDALIESLEQLIAKKRHIKQGAMQELLTGTRRLTGFKKKPGCKQSEVGVIPEDWKVRPLLDLVKCIHGKAHEQYILDGGRYVVVNAKFVSTEGKIRKYASKNFCKADIGDVLMVLSDLPNGKALAKCFFVKDSGKYAVNQRVCIYRSKFESTKFIFYLLNRNKFFLSLDDGVTQTHILNGDIRRCEIALPRNKEEQTAIANVLSDIDAEITTLETKLSKLRRLKQGMMHELLTGRIRLV